MRIFRLLTLLMLLTAVIGVASCSDSSPTTPTPIDVSGTWGGTISNVTLGNATLALILTQTSNTITGTWSETYAKAVNNASGTATGAVTGSNLVMTLTPSVASICPDQLTATVSNSASMSGGYVTFSCATDASGTFAATRK